LWQERLLPSGFVVLGAARSQLDDQQFRLRLKEGVAKFSRRSFSEKAWEKFSENVFYESVDGQVSKDFVRLKTRLESLGQLRAQTFNYLFYLAVSSSYYGDIAANLNQAGLIEKPGQGRRATYLLVEKPFGIDRASARVLNQRLREHFFEEQIFRIDHYLGKETVQNILVFRFANGIFEPLWNRNYIESIQISMAEEIGVGSRASYFDQAGILRDIVQNHLLQIMALLCIEPPISLNDPDSIRNEKVKVLRSVRKFGEAEILKGTVRAQYEEGFIFGEPVPAYRHEKGVGADSNTETYCALKLEIDNWRWSGVPIYIRAGKRLPKRITEVAVYFRRAPTALFEGRQVGEIEPNVLAIQVQPDEGISLRIESKPPGPRLRVMPVDMDFRYGSSFGALSADAYERLLLDAMNGDPTLFTRDDEIDQSWSLLDPVLEMWRDGAVKLHGYEAGTWGPSAADELLLQNGQRWRNL
ncbi:MAG: glucose-6-phosphate dehydrogenase, partial [Deltaproteobacteria bacterium]|nr:glucose-6-phosphate dehydrogenase [Deltaproteobacteria bacterium]